MFSKLFEKVNSPTWQNNLWTLLSSGVLAVYVSLIVLLTVRLIGLAEGGMISFAVAVASLCYVFVLFGVRPFQSTDINENCTFNTYLGLRVFSTLLAAVGLLIFLVERNFEITRTISILLLSFVYFTDGFVDVFMGDLQQKGNMRVAGRMRVCAFGLSLASYAIAAYITRTLITPLLISSSVVLLVYIIWIWVYRKQFKKVRVKFDLPSIKSLTCVVLPLLVAGLIFTFLVNAQKYYLGFLVSDESVAVFSMLFIPVTAFTLLCNSFFSGAEMTRTANVYINGSYVGLSKRVNRQLLLAIGLSLFFIICSVSFGIPLLSWIYNTDLSLYRREFMLLAVGGSTVSVLSVINAALVIMKLQISNLIIISAIAVVAVPFMWFLVSQYGLSGASYANLVIYLPFAVFCFLFYVISLKKRKSSVIR